MKSAYIVAKQGGHQSEWGEAFAAGLRRHGLKVEINPSEPTSVGHLLYDVVVLWGVRKKPAIQRQLKDGGQVCILERGYLGDRFNWTSVSFGGGLNGRGEFRGISSDRSRFDRHFGTLMQPWQARDGYALLIGQVPGDMSLAGCGGDLRRWYDDVSQALIDKGYEVRFRPHPLAGKSIGPIHGAEKVKTVGGQLLDALSGASLCVTFNSNTGVESVLAGVPTVAMDRGSMAWPVTTHFVETEPQTPDRQTWAAELAWKQWTIEEMRSGECWEHVGCG